VRPWFSASVPRTKRAFFGLIAILLDFDLVVAIHAVARKKACDIADMSNRVREHRLAELGAEVAVNLDLRSLGIDQYAARVVVREKRHMPGFIRSLDPLAVLPCPRNSQAMVR